MASIAKDIKNIIEQETGIDWKKVPKSAIIVLKMLMTEQQKFFTENSEDGIQKFRIKPQDLAKKINSPPRTIRYALKKLIDLQIIGRFPDLNDLRTFYYYIPKN